MDSHSVQEVLWSERLVFEMMFIEKSKPLTILQEKQLMTIDRIESCIHSKKKKLINGMEEKKTKCVHV